ncbi:hypothetical protein NXS19_011977 [Fusarium pseudograminearum]|nr:hypothetical protein NXS19_011977 [Fusarium pseudograminearum]
MPSLVSSSVSEETSSANTNSLATRTTLPLPDTLQPLLLPRMVSPSWVAPSPLDLEKYETDKKIEDEEILKILEQPIARNTGKKKSKPKKKTAKKEGDEE